MEVQADISRDLLINKRGQKITVLCDTQEGPNTIARSAADAPEIDGVVIIEDTQLSPGEFATVEITGSDEHDLWAKA